MIFHDLFVSLHYLSNPLSCASSVVGTILSSAGRWRGHWPSGRSVTCTPRSSSPSSGLAFRRRSLRNQVSSPGRSLSSKAFFKSQIWVFVLFYHFFKCDAFVWLSCAFCIDFVFFFVFVFWSLCCSNSTAFLLLTFYYLFSFLLVLLSCTLPLFFCHIWRCLFSAVNISCYHIKV